jgi:flagellar biosynthesis protein FlhF
MDVRTFRAPTMQEALALVRRELGPDAAVLHTRELRGSPWLRWIPGLRQIEVTAALNVNVPSRLATREAARTPAAAYAAHSQQHASLRPAAGQTRPAFEQQIKGQLDELHSLVADLCRRTQGPGLAGLPEVLFRVYTDLIDAEVDQILAGELIAALRQDPTLANVADPVLVKARLVRMLENELRVAPPLDLSRGRRVAALVGPTGVGKTTTIAKLAANLKLREHQRVGLITIDTYRIAAIDQLKRFADIIGAPLRVVGSPDDQQQAIESMCDCHYILIDTAGRSPNDTLKLGELKSFLHRAGPDEVHLVLSCTASQPCVELAVQRFGEVRVDKLIFTKLDEAAHVGHIVNVIQKIKKPLSYVTTGQDVPDDIEVGKGRKLADMILRKQ